MLALPKSTTRPACPCILPWWFCHSQSGSQPRLLDRPPIYSLAPRVTQALEFNAARMLMMLTYVVSLDSSPELQPNTQGPPWGGTQCPAATSESAHLWDARSFRPGVPRPFSPLPFSCSHITHSVHQHILWVLPNNRSHDASPSLMVSSVTFSGLLTTLIAPNIIVSAQHQEDH